MATKARKLAGAILVVSLTCGACLTLPFLLDCIEHVPEKYLNVSEVCQPDKPNEWQQLAHRVVCAGRPGNRSPLVALLLDQHESAIKALFHVSESLEPSRFTPPVTLTYWLYSFVFALLTYGLPLPSGLFVPCIMQGAALGRLFYSLGATGRVSAGEYALVGAAGMLGGVCRMTISITVIVVESTGNVAMAMPIALTILLAKVRAPSPAVPRSRPPSSAVGALPCPPMRPSSDRAPSCSRRSPEISSMRASMTSTSQSRAIRCSQQSPPPRTRRCERAT